MTLSLLGGQLCDLGDHRLQSWNLRLREVLNPRNLHVVSFFLLLVFIYSKHFFSVCCIYTNLFIDFPGFFLWLDPPVTFLLYCRGCVCWFCLVFIYLIHSACVPSVRVCGHRSKNKLLGEKGSYDSADGGDQKHTT